MITLSISNETKRRVPKTLFDEILKRLPKAHPITQKSVELLLTDNETIQALNKQYRQKDYATDVLSFPWDGPSLGQIVISVDKTKEQAEELGQSFEEELKFLFSHGLLHLLGYDHETKKEEEVMLSKTYFLLNRTPKN